MALRRGTTGKDDAPAGRGTAMTELDDKRLTPEMWRQLSARGLNDVEIAKEAGVSKQAVFNMRQTYGIELPMSRANRMFPWPVEGRQAQDEALCRHLRRHAMWMAVGRKGMSLTDRKRLKGFYKRLKDHREVVEWDPAVPPQKGVSRTGGWTYRKWDPSDGDLIIRLNAHVVPHIDDEFLEFWAFPDEWPKALGQYD